MRYNLVVHRNGEQSAVSIGYMGTIVFLIALSDAVMQILRRLLSWAFGTEVQSTWQRCVRISLHGHLFIVQSRTPGQEEVGLGVVYWAESCNALARIGALLKK